MSNSKPGLSVVIIGRNEGARLTRCLESVTRMRWFDGSVEVVYVDSQSTDGSPEVAASFGARVVGLSEGRPTAARGRNAGWRVATAPLVLFLDGDTILDAAFAEKAARAMATHLDVAVVWGHRREISTSDSVFNRVLDLDWIYAPGVTDFCGGDALMKRSVLEDVGGYDETLIAGEEPEMCRRMRAAGVKILHIDEPMTGHDMAMTRWSQYWKRAFRAGYAYAEVSSRFRGTASPFWEEDARRNRVRGSVLLLAPLAALVISLAEHSFLPAVLAAVAFAALVLRSARKAAWKSNSWTTRLLYGLHSHVQQIPILFGQIRYFLDRKHGRRQQLIEYKEPSL